MAPGEENVFAELILNILPLIHNKSYNESAVDALSAIWYVACVKIVVGALISQKHETWPANHSKSQGNYPGVYEVDRLRNPRGHPWYIFSSPLSRHEPSNRLDRLVSVHQGPSGSASLAFHNPFVLDSGRYQPRGRPLPAP